jgi:hypothetical protein
MWKAPDIQDDVAMMRQRSVTSEVNERGRRRPEVGGHGVTSSSVRLSVRHYPSYPVLACCAGLIQDLGFGASQAAGPPPSPLRTTLTGEEGTGPGEYMIADHRQQEAGRVTGERLRTKGGGLLLVRLVVVVLAGNKATTGRLGFGEASHVERRRGFQE